jgi:hypothetical protein
MDRRLEGGDELHCPHCRHWHPVYQPHTYGTDATLRMLYFDCKGVRYFAGFINAPSRHPTRPPTPSSSLDQEPSSRSSMGASAT